MTTTSPLLPSFRSKFADIEDCGGETICWDDTNDTGLLIDVQNFNPEDNTYYVTIEQEVEGEDGDTEYNLLWYDSEFDLQDDVKLLELVCAWVNFGGDPSDL